MFLCMDQLLNLAAKWRTYDPSRASRTGAGSLGSGALHVAQEPPGCLGLGSRRLPLEEPL
jgi:hypothetical protein